MLICVQFMASPGKSSAMTEQPTPAKDGAPKRAKKITPATLQVAAGSDVFVRPTQEAAGGVERFDNFISWTLQKGVTELLPPQLVIATVLTQEGLVTEKDLLDSIRMRSKSLNLGCRSFRTADSCL